MNRRLPKVLALLESEHDPEALQALRTAQRLLSQDDLTIGGIVDAYLARRSLPTGVVTVAEQAALQQENKRYRLAWEQMAAQRDQLEKDNERLRAHLESRGELGLFVRLREREDNVTALTKEIRRLKDELFKAEHRIRSWSGGRSTGGPKKTQRAAAQEAVGEAMVLQWVQLFGLEGSQEPADWVSVRQLYSMFLKGQVSFDQQRVRLDRGVGSTVEARRSVVGDQSLTRQQFAGVLGRVLGVDVRDGADGPGPKQAGEPGFCVRSRYEVEGERRPPRKGA